MIPEINRILYATDMGDHMRPVFRYAVCLAQKHGAKIVATHVLEPIHSEIHYALEASLSKDQADKFVSDGLHHVEHKMHGRLVQFCEDEMGETLENCELLSDIVVLRGRTAETIIEEAERLDVDLIIVGTHTDTSFGAHLLGSTARTLTQLSRIPVLVIPVYEK
ncbi:MAG: universal stress protein [Proteobacteria bacterium]|nr:universal stress protein [Pseudomonadota bacterium]